MRTISSIRTAALVVALVVTAFRQRAEHAGADLEERQS
jgi:hypothetical protein